jgi:hypothetical protein
MVTAMRSDLEHFSRTRQVILVCEAAYMCCMLLRSEDSGQFNLGARYESGIFSVAVSSYRKAFAQNVVA